MINHKFQTMKKLKTLISIVVLVLLFTPAFAQNVAINEDGSTPNPNAILDLKSAKKGLLIPRIDSNTRKTIPNVAGLIVYDKDYNSLWFNDGWYGWRELKSDTGNTAAALQIVFPGGNTIAGEGAGLRAVTGHYNSFLGAESDASADSLVNATAVGYHAIVNSSNKVRIGNAAVTVIEGQVPFTTPSDGRFKFQVQEDVKGLDFILKLRPVTYQFDVEKFENSATRGPKIPRAPAAIQASYKAAAAIRRSGFIAQEVEQAAQSSGYSFSGIVRPAGADDHYSLSYESFVVPLVKAVQEQQQRITAQDQKIERLQKQLEALKTLINANTATH